METTEADHTPEPVPSLMKIEEANKDFTLGEPEKPLEIIVGLTESGPQVSCNVGTDTACTDFSRNTGIPESITFSESLSIASEQLSTERETHQVDDNTSSQIGMEGSENYKQLVDEYVKAAVVIDKEQNEIADEEKMFVEKDDKNLEAGDVGEAGLLISKIEESRAQIGEEEIQKQDISKPDEKTENEHLSEENSKIIDDSKENTKDEKAENETSKVGNEANSCESKEATSQTHKLVANNVIDSSNKKVSDLSQQKESTYDVVTIKTTSKKESIVDSLSDGVKEKDSNFCSSSLNQRNDQNITEVNSMIEAVSNKQMSSRIEDNTKDKLAEPSVIPIADLSGFEKVDIQVVDKLEQASTVALVQGNDKLANVRECIEHASLIEEIQKKNDELLSFVTKTEKVHLQNFDNLEISGVISDTVLEGQVKRSMEEKGQIDVVMESTKADTIVDGSIKSDRERHVGLTIKHEDKAITDKDSSYVPVKASEEVNIVAVTTSVPDINEKASISEKTSRKRYVQQDEKEILETETRSTINFEDEDAIISRKCSEAIRDVEMDSDIKSQKESYEAKQEEEEDGILKETLRAISESRFETPSKVFTETDGNAKEEMLKERNDANMKKLNATDDTKIEKDETLKEKVEAIVISEKDATMTIESAENTKNDYKDMFIQTEKERYEEKEKDPESIEGLETKTDVTSKEKIRSSLEIFEHVNIEVVSNKAENLGVSHLPEKEAMQVVGEKLKRELNVESQRQVFEEEVTSRYEDVEIKSETDLRNIAEYPSIEGAISAKTADNDNNFAIQGDDVIKDVVNINELKQISMSPREILKQDGNEIEKKESTLAMSYEKNDVVVSDELTEMTANAKEEPYTLSEKEVHEPMGKEPTTIDDTEIASDGTLKEKVEVIVITERDAITLSEFGEITKTDKEDMYIVTQKEIYEAKEKELQANKGAEAEIDGTSEEKVEATNPPSNERTKIEVLSSKVDDLEISQLLNEKAILAAREKLEKGFNVDSHKNFTDEEVASKCEQHIDIEFETSERDILLQDPSAEEAISIKSMDTNDSPTTTIEKVTKHVANSIALEQTEERLENFLQHDGKEIENKETTLTMISNEKDAIISYEQSETIVIFKEKTSIASEREILETTGKKLKAADETETENAETLGKKVEAIIIPEKDAIVSSEYIETTKGDKEDILIVTQKEICEPKEKELKETEAFEAKIDGISEEKNSPSNQRNEHVEIEVLGSKAENSEIRHLLEKEAIPVAREKLEKELKVESREHVFKEEVASRCEQHIDIDSKVSEREVSLQYPSVKRAISIKNMDNDDSLSIVREEVTEDVVSTNALKNNEKSLKKNLQHDGKEKENKEMVENSITAYEYATVIDKKQHETFEETRMFEEKDDRSLEAQDMVEAGLLISKIEEPNILNIGEEVQKQDISKHDEKIENEHLPEENFKIIDDNKENIKDEKDEHEVNSCESKEATSETHNLAAINVMDNSTEKTSDLNQQKESTFDVAAIKTTSKKENIVGLLDRVEEKEYESCSSSLNQHKDQNTIEVDSIIEAVSDKQMSSGIKDNTKDKLTDSSKDQIDLVSKSIKVNTIVNVVIKSERERFDGLTIKHEDKAITDGDNSYVPIKAGEEVNIVAVTTSVPDINKKGSTSEESSVERIYGIISHKCSEAITKVKMDSNIQIQKESYESKQEEEDDGIPKEMNLLLEESTERIEQPEIEVHNSNTKNVKTSSMEKEPILEEGEKIEKTLNVESHRQISTGEEAFKSDEKHVEIELELREKENTTLIGCPPLDEATSKEKRNNDDNLIIAGKEFIKNEVPITTPEPKDEIEIQNDETLEAKVEAITISEKDATITSELIETTKIDKKDVFIETEKKSYEEKEKDHKSVEAFETKTDVTSEEKVGANIPSSNEMSEHPKIKVLPNKAENLGVGNLPKKEVMQVAGEKLKRELNVESQRQVFKEEVTSRCEHVEIKFKTSERETVENPLVEGAISPFQQDGNEIENKESIFTMACILKEKEIHEATRKEPKTTNDTEIENDGTLKDKVEATIITERDAITSSLFIETTKNDKEDMYIKTQKEIDEAKEKELQATEGAEVEIDGTLEEKVEATNPPSNKKTEIEVLSSKAEDSETSHLLEKKIILVTGEKLERGFDAESHKHVTDEEVASKCEHHVNIKFETSEREILLQNPPIEGTISIKNKDIDYSLAIMIEEAIKDSRNTIALEQFEERPEIFLQHDGKEAENKETTLTTIYEEKDVIVSNEPTEIIVSSKEETYFASEKEIHEATGKKLKATDDTEIENTRTLGKKAEEIVIPEKDVIISSGFTETTKGDKEDMLIETQKEINEVKEKEIKETEASEAEIDGISEEKNPTSNERNEHAEIEVLSSKAEHSEIPHLFEETEIPVASEKLDKELEVESQKHVFEEELASKCEQHIDIESEISEKEFSLQYASVEGSISIENMDNDDSPTTVKDTVSTNALEKNEESLEKNSQHDGKEKEIKEIVKEEDLVKPITNEVNIQSSTQTSIEQNLVDNFQNHEENNEFSNTKSSVQADTVEGGLLDKNENVAPCKEFQEEKREEDGFLVDASENTPPKGGEDLEQELQMRSPTEASKQSVNVVAIETKNLIISEDIVIQNEEETVDNEKKEKEVEDNGVATIGSVKLQQDNKVSVEESRENKSMKEMEIKPLIAKMEEEILDKKQKAKDITEDTVAESTTKNINEVEIVGEIDGTCEESPNKFAVKEDITSTIHQESIQQETSSSYNELRKIVVTEEIPQSNSLDSSLDKSSAILSKEIDSSTGESKIEIHFVTQQVGVIQDKDTVKNSEEIHSEYCLDKHRRLPPDNLQSTSIPKDVELAMEEIEDLVDDSETLAYDKSLKVTKEDLKDNEEANVEKRKDVLKKENLPISQVCLVKESTTFEHAVTKVEPSFHQESETNEIEIYEMANEEVQKEVNKVEDIETLQKFNEDEDVKKEFHTVTTEEKIDNEVEDINVVDGFKDHEVEEQQPGEAKKEIEEASKTESKFDAVETHSPQEHQTPSLAECSNDEIKNDTVQELRGDEGIKVNDQTLQESKEEDQTPSCTLFPKDASGSILKSDSEDKATNNLQEKAYEEHDTIPSDVLLTKEEDNITSNTNEVLLVEESEVNEEVLLESQHDKGVQETPLHEKGTIRPEEEISEAYLDEIKIIKEGSEAVHSGNQGFETFYGAERSTNQDFLMDKSAERQDIIISTELSSNQQVHPKEVSIPKIESEKFEAPVTVLEVNNDSQKEVEINKDEARAADNMQINESITKSKGPENEISLVRANTREDVLESEKGEVSTDSGENEINEKHVEEVVPSLMPELSQSNKPIDATELTVCEAKKLEVLKEKQDLESYNTVLPIHETDKESSKVHEQKAEEALVEKEAEKEVADEKIEITIGSKRSIYEDLHQTTNGNQRANDSFPIYTEENKVKVEGTMFQFERQGNETAIGNATGSKAIYQEENILNVTLKEQISNDKLQTTEVNYATGKNDISQVIVPDRSGQIKSSATRDFEPIYSNDVTLEEKKPENMKAIDATSSKDIRQVIEQVAVGEIVHSTATRDSQPARAVEVSSAEVLELATDKGIDDNKEKSNTDSVQVEYAKISLFDMMQRSKRERLEKKELSEVKEETKVEEEVVKSEREISDEEKEEGNEEGDDHKKTDSVSEGPVTVEGTKDMKMKIAHKKSHNILSGVGSKVKHSISKVRKAITGKHSHPKQQSPKSQDK